MRDRDLAQRCHVLAGHDARVEVREEPGFLEDEPRTAREVLERRLAAELRELFPCRAVAELGLVTEREERLAAPAAAPAAATSSTSSSGMYARSPRRGGRAKVQ